MYGRGEAIDQHVIDITRATLIGGLELSVEDKQFLVDNFDQYHLLWNDHANQLEYFTPEDADRVQPQVIQPIHADGGQGPTIITDGSPRFSTGSLQDKEKVQQLYNASGPFHEYLESYKMWGKMFRTSHLEIIVTIGALPRIS